MNKSLYLFVAALLIPAVSQADSIRVGDAYYRDVYIRTTKDFYHVYFPEDGTTERVSRRRSNVSDVNISEDAAYRAGLLERYEVAKAGAAKEPKAAKTVRSLEGDLLKHRQSMKELAEFEAQLAHWKTLAPETREAIAAGLDETLAVQTARRAAEHEQALADRAELGHTKSAVEQEWASAARNRDVAVDRARAEDESEFYLRAYENSKGYVGPYYHFYRDHEDRLRAYSWWWYTEDPSLYNAALAERELTAEEIAAVERSYAERATTLESELESVEQRMRQRERDARASVSKAYDESVRFGNRQSRIAALESALENEYRPQLAVTTLESWTGATAGQLPEFRVARGIWRIDCDAPMASDDFAVTVYNAETGQPFTRIGSRDFLGMRMRVFDEPGTYYLEVDPGFAAAAYEIRVSLVSYR